MERHSGRTRAYCGVSVACSLRYLAVIVGYEQKAGCSLMYTSPVDLSNLIKVQSAAYCFATVIAQIDSSIDASRFSPSVACG